MRKFLLVAMCTLLFFPSVLSQSTQRKSLLESFEEGQRLKRLSTQEESKCLAEPQPPDSGNLKTTLAACRLAVRYLRQDLTSYEESTGRSYDEYIQLKQENERLQSLVITPPVVFAWSDDGQPSSDDSGTYQMYMSVRLVSELSDILARESQSDTDLTRLLARPRPLSAWASLPSFKSARGFYVWATEKISDDTMIYEVYMTEKAFREHSKRILGRFALATMAIPQTTEKVIADPGRQSQQTDSVIWELRQMNDALDNIHWELFSTRMDAEQARLDNELRRITLRLRKRHLP